MEFDISKNCFRIVKAGASRTFHKILGLLNFAALGVMQSPEKAWKQHFLLDHYKVMTKKI